MDALTRRALGIPAPQCRAKCPRCLRTVVVSRQKDKTTGLLVWRLRRHGWWSRDTMGGPACTQETVDARLVDDSEVRRERANDEAVASYERTLAREAIL